MAECIPTTLSSGQQLALVKRKLNTLEPIILQMLSLGKATSILKEKLAQAELIAMDIPDECTYVTSEWRGKLAKWYRDYSVTEVEADNQRQQKLQEHQLQQQLQVELQKTATAAPAVASVLEAPPPQDYSKPTQQAEAPLPAVPPPPQVEQYKPPAPQEQRPLPPIDDWGALQEQRPLPPIDDWGAPQEQRPLPPIDDWGAPQEQRPLPPIDDWGAPQEQRPLPPIDDWGASPEPESAPVPLRVPKPEPVQYRAPEPAPAPYRASEPAPATYQAPEPEPAPYRAEEPPAAGDDDWSNDDWSAPPKEKDEPSYAPSFGREQQLRQQQLEQQQKKQQPQAQQFQQPPSQQAQQFQQPPHQHKQQYQQQQFQQPPPPQQQQQQVQPSPPALTVQSYGRGGGDLYEPVSSTPIQANNNQAPTNYNNAGYGGGDYEAYPDTTSGGDHFTAEQQNLMKEVKEAIECLPPVTDFANTDQLKRLVKLVARSDDLIDAYWRDAAMQSQLMEWMYPKMPKEKWDQFWAYLGFGVPRTVRKLRQFLIRQVRVVYDELRVKAEAKKASQPLSEADAEKYCVYCKGQGHLVDHCIQIKYTLCFICFEDGHTQRRCRYAVPQNQQYGGGYQGGRGGYKGSGGGYKGGGGYGSGGHDTQ